MKKLFSIAIATLMAAGIAAIPLTTRADVQATADAQPTAETETAKVYLLPGSYLKDGERVQNTVADSTPLTATEKDALHLEGNVYEAGPIGDSLPLAVTTQKDKAGNAYTFNGWWYIVDATVTYTDVVPEVTETTYLYADFRADLSQRKDPVAPAPQAHTTIFASMSVAAIKRISLPRLTAAPFPCSSGTTGWSSKRAISSKSGSRGISVPKNPSSCRITIRINIR